MGHGGFGGPSPAVEIPWQNSLLRNECRLCAEVKMSKRSFCDFCDAQLLPNGSEYGWVEDDSRVQECSAKALGCVVRGKELVLQVHVQLLMEQQMCENCLGEALNSAFPAGAHLRAVHSPIGA